MDSTPALKPSSYLSAWMLLDLGPVSLLCLLKLALGGGFHGFVLIAHALVPLRYELTAYALRLATE